MKRKVFQKIFASIILSCGLVSAFAQGGPSELDSGRIAHVVALPQSKVFLDKIPLSSPQERQKIDYHNLVEVDYRSSKEIHLFSRDYIHKELLLGTWKRKGKSTSMMGYFGENTYEAIYSDSRSNSKLYEQYIYYSLRNDSLTFYTDSLKEHVKWNFKLMSVNNRHLVVKTTQSGVLTFDRVSDNTSPLQTRKHTFHLQAGKLICGFTQYASAQQGSCLRLSEDLFVGMTKEELTKELWFAKFHKVSDTKWTFHDGRSTIALHFKDDHLRNIKWYGFGDSGRFDFAGISVGDMITYLEQRLGKPTVVKRAKEKGDATEWWYYEPFHFRIQIQAEKVHVIELGDF